MKRKIHLIGTKANLEQYEPLHQWEMDPATGMSDTDCEGMGATIIDMLVRGCVCVSVQTTNA